MISDPSTRGFGPHVGDSQDLYDKLGKLIRPASQLNRSGMEFRVVLEHLGIYDAEKGGA